MCGSTFVLIIWLLDK